MLLILGALFKFRLLATSTSVQSNCSLQLNSPCSLGNLIFAIRKAMEIVHSLCWFSDRRLLATSCSIVDEGHFNNCVHAALNLQVPSEHSEGFLY